MNLDFTFLTEEQIFGDNRLNIFEHYGTKAATTDFFSILNRSAGYDYNWWWTKSISINKLAVTVSALGNTDITNPSETFVGARPALSYSQISSQALNKKQVKDGLLEVEFGEYPQKVVSKELGERLERAIDFYVESIGLTGKKYHIFTKNGLETVDEYDYADGKKYIRIKVNPNSKFINVTLSNGENYKTGDYVWIEVQPIKWLVDEENDIAISEKILFAGVPFNNTGVYEVGKFANTTIKKFMDEYFSKDIIAPLKKQKNIEKDNLEILDALFQYMRNGGNKEILINFLQDNDDKNISTDAIEKSNNQEEDITVDNIEKNEEELDIFEEALLKMNNILQGTTTTSLVTEETSNDKVKRKFKKIM